MYEGSSARTSCCIPASAPGCQTILQWRARVPERVELSAPWSAQATGVVQLQLVVLGELITHEDTWEKLEVILLKWLVAQAYIVFLRPRIALRVHLPVFAAESCHQAELARIVRQGGVEGVNIVLVYEAIVVELVFHKIIACPAVAVYEAFLRCVLFRQIG